MRRKQFSVGSAIESALDCGASRGKLHVKDGSARVRVADLLVKSQVGSDIRTQRSGDLLICTMRIL